MRDPLGRTTGVFVLITRIKRWIWFSLASRLSTVRTARHIWIGALAPDRSSESSLLDKVEAALDLIAAHDPHRLNRLSRDLKYIWVTSFPWGNGHYHAGFDVCHLHDQFVRNPNVSPARLASTIVHEATHARIHHHGIQYKASLRQRIEHACAKSQLAFATRLPDGASEVERLSAILQAPPRDRSDERFRRAIQAARIQWLVTMGAPGWLLRLLSRRRAA